MLRGTRPSLPPSVQALWEPGMQRGRSCCEWPPCSRHSVHVISAMPLDKPTHWALLPQFTDAERGSRTLPKDTQLAPHPVPSGHCTASSIQEPGPGSAARVPQAGWSHIGRADPGTGRRIRDPVHRRPGAPGKDHLLCSQQMHTKSEASLAQAGGWNLQETSTTWN